MSILCEYIFPLVLQSFLFLLVCCLVLNAVSCNGLMEQEYTMQMQNVQDTIENTHLIADIARRAHANAIPLDRKYRDLVSRNPQFYAHDVVQVCHVCYCFLQNLTLQDYHHCFLVFHFLILFVFCLLWFVFPLFRAEFRSILSANMADTYPLLLFCSFALC